MSRDLITSMSHEATALESGRVRVATDLAVATGVTLTSLAILLATSAEYGMVWDEGHTIRRERTLATWIEWVVQPAGGRSRGEAFSERTLEKYWPFSREEPDGHPPFYAMLGLVGWWLAHNHLAPLTAYRFGPMALCAATAGILYFHLARRHGRLAAATAAGTFVFMPRLFSHAHYAHYDMPMSCLWVLAQIAFLNSLRSARWIVPFGVLLGLAAGTKFTGWFAPLASLAWITLVEIAPWLRRMWTGEKPRDTCGSNYFVGTKAVLAGLVIGLVVLYVMQPPWWPAPWQGIARFLSANLSRPDTKPIPTMYLGTVYGFSLPWHNTLVLTAVTVPTFVLGFGALGIIASVLRCRTDREPLIWVLSWSVLMVVRALPAAPGHDGTRQFLPSIVTLAVLAGLGAEWLRARCQVLRISWLATVLAAFAVAESLIGIVWLYPYTLSYYNIAVGNLRGAERHGFELTYYWDTIGPEFLGWVRAQAEPADVELRFPSDLVNIRFLREWSELPAQVRIVGLENTEEPCYVLQRRHGGYYPYDWWLEQNGKPCFTITRQGVDLLRVYPYQESLRAYEATRNSPIPEHLRH